MSQGALVLQRLFDGLANGSLYGSLALAIALVYRASGRVNLAQGELATFGTYLSLVLSSPAAATLAGTVWAARFLPGAPWPLWLAIPAAMVVSAAVGVVLERYVIRRLADTATQAAVSVSVALMLLINAASTQWWRPGQRGYPSPFPNNTDDQFIFGAVRLRYATVGTWLTLLAVLVVLHLVLLRSKFGLAFRAVASQRTNATLVGIRAGRVVSGAWALAAALGTLVGCLSASRLQLTPGMMMKLLVFSLVSATIGGLSSPGGALAGGAIVGVGQSFAAGYVPGVDTNLAFPLIVLAMVTMLYLRPQGLFGVASHTPEVEPPPQARPAVPAEARWRVRRDAPSFRVVRTVAVVALIGLVGLGGFVLPYLETRLFTEVVATALALWGLAMLVGDAGRISLGHATFMGVGGYATAVLAARTGLPELAAVAVAVLVGLVAGVILGLPALRIRGQYLAMVTLALAVIFPSLLSRFTWLTGGEFGPPPTKKIVAPAWLGIPGERSNAWLHIIVVAIAVVVAWMLHNLRSSSIGRAVRAAAQNEEAAAAMGVSVTRVRTLVFGLSAGLGALGGALVALQTQAVTSSRYEVFRSLALYALVAVCGAGGLTGATLAAVAFVGLPWLMVELGLNIGAAGVPPDAPGGGAYLLWGVALVVGTIVAPGGLVPAVRRWLGRWVAVVESSPGRESGPNSMRPAVSERTPHPV